MVITVVALAFLFFTQTAETVGESVENTTDKKFDSITTNFRIDSTAGNIVYIRNTGGATISNESFTFYVNDQLVSAESTVATIEPGQTVEFTLATGLTDYTLEVTGSGDSAQAVVKPI